ncbi:MAG: hypothetical protein ACOYUZ_01875 [Patescibacteria group bacterium]
MLHKIEQILEKRDIQTSACKYFDHRAFDPINPYHSANHTGYVYFSRGLPDLHLQWKIYYPSDDVEAESWRFQFSLVFSDNAEMKNSRAFSVCADFGTELWEIAYTDELDDKQPDIDSRLGNDFAANHGININERKYLMRAQAMNVLRQMADFFKQRIIESR